MSIASVKIQVKKNKNNVTYVNVGITRGAQSSFKKYEIGNTMRKLHSEHLA